MIHACAGAVAIHIYSARAQKTMKLRINDIPHDLVVMNAWVKRFDPRDRSIAEYNRHGVDTVANFMLGLEHETWPDFFSSFLLHRQGNHFYLRNPSGVLEVCLYAETEETVRLRQEQAYEALYGRFDREALKRKRDEAEQEKAFLESNKFGWTMNRWGYLQ